MSDKSSSKVSSPLGTFLRVSRLHSKLLSVTSHVFFGLPSLLRTTTFNLRTKKCDHFCLCKESVLAFVFSYCHGVLFFVKASRKRHIIIPGAHCSKHCKLNNVVKMSTK